MANTPPPRPQPRNAYRSLGESDSGSAAAKRLAEEKANRGRNAGMKRPRTDRYGNSGMGENYMGVLNKDLKKLDQTVANTPGIYAAIPQKVSRRGNIETVKTFSGK